MFFILSRVWDEEKTLCSHEELNLRPSHCNSDWFWSEFCHTDHFCANEK